MPDPKPRWSATAAKQKLREANEILSALGFTGKQANTTAGYVLLALLDLKPNDPWAEASSPLRGITPIIEFIAEAYRVRYAPNTRETVRDEAVKYFVEAALLDATPIIRNAPRTAATLFIRSSRLHFRCANHLAR